MVSRTTSSANMYQFTLEQIANSLVETNKSLHAMNESLQKVSTDVAVLKSQDWAVKYDELRKRCDALEAQEHKDAGAADVVTWMLKNVVPWIIAALSAIGSLWMASHKGPH